MLIINYNHKDYYDGVAGATGIDKTIVFDRKTVVFEGKDIPELFHHEGYISSRDERKNPFYSLGNSSLKKEFQKAYPFKSYFIIGFCGKLYVGYRLHSEKTDFESKFDTYHNVNTRIIYDLDYMKTIFQQESWTGHFTDKLNYIVNYNAIDVFRELNSPIFLYEEDQDRLHIDFHRNWYRSDCNPRFVINPTLKDYEFYRVFDTYQAFQEISMFIGGVLGNKEKDIAVIDDKYKIAQHGFDKWSFRKEPKDKK